MKFSLVENCEGGGESRDLSEMDVMNVMWAVDCPEDIIVATVLMAKLMGSATFSRDDSYSFTVLAY